MQLTKVIKGKTTNSCTYFLPLLAEHVDFKYLNSIKNAYMWNNDEERAFCVLYKFRGEQNFLRFEGELTSHELFIDHEDHATYTLYKFRIPEDMKWIMTMIKERKVSMLDEDSKKTIIDFNIKRLQPIEMIEDVLSGKFPVRKTYMEDETFSNFVRTGEIIDANEIYKRKKDE